MITTNILTVLTMLNQAGVRVSLLNNYNPANVTEKADATQQTVRFTQTEQFYKLPEYEISSAANLNIKFALKGTATDLTTGKVYEDVVQFKTVSIVKNGELFKQSLDICPDDVQTVRDLGFDVTEDNKIDLTQFDLATGIDCVSDDDFAKAIVEQYVYDSFRQKAKKAPAAERTEEEKRLIDNGFDPNTKVWRPIICGGYERVKNVNADTITWIVNNQKTTPRLDDIQKRIAEGKKLSEPQQKLYDLSKTGYQFEDHAQQINAIKYARIATKTLPTFTKTITLNGVDFVVQVQS